MLKKLSNIQKDKLLHFFWGTILSFVLIIYFGIVGMIIALIIPAVKELYYDKYLGKGNCEWADYFYSIAPTIMLAIMKYQWLNLLLMQDILTIKTGHITLLKLETPLIGDTFKILSEQDTQLVNSCLSIVSDKINLFDK